MTTEILNFLPFCVGIFHDNAVDDFAPLTEVILESVLRGVVAQSTDEEFAELFVFGVELLVVARPPTPTPSPSTSESSLTTAIAKLKTREREMFYLTTHSTHFIYGYMASDIWLRTILIVRKETCCRHIGYSYRLAARVLLYAPYHRQDNTYHGLCYTSRGALAGTRNSSMGSPHEGSI